MTSKQGLYPDYDVIVDANVKSLLEYAQIIHNFRASGVIRFIPQIYIYYNICIIVCDLYF